jgi:KDO2-lipid IV(A) lauroyltransferase
MHKGLVYFFGNLIYLMPIKRNKISQKNIELCFPKLSQEERKKLHKLNVIASAKIIFDSGISWFWSDKRINKLISYEIRGLENLLEEQKNNNGILLFFKHSLHLELDARLLGMNAEIYGVERVHNSDSFDSIQNKGRLKSVKDTCDRNNPLKFIRWLKNGKTVLYATDQDYGLSQSDIVNFFNHPAATISAPQKIIKSTKCKTFFVNSFMENDKYILEVEQIFERGNRSEEQRAFEMIMRPPIGLLTLCMHHFSMLPRKDEGGQDDPDEYGDSQIRDDCHDRHNNDDDHVGDRNFANQAQA